MGTSTCCVVHLCWPRVMHSWPPRVIIARTWPLCANRHTTHFGAKIKVEHLNKILSYRFWLSGGSSSMVGSEQTNAFSQQLAFIGCVSWSQYVQCVVDIPFNVTSVKGFWSALVEKLNFGELKYILLPQNSQLKTCQYPVIPTVH